MNLANKLTVGRLGVTVVFFAALELLDPAYALPGLPPGPERRIALLNVALVLFLLAAITDVLDGWVARRYDMTSDFGRVADPFTDKVLTCGAFVFLSTLPIRPGERAVYIPAWVTVLIIAREFLVTGLRGFVESKGHAFGASILGKAKMLVQCATIAWVLLALGNLAEQAWARLVARALVWTTLALTLASGASYVTAAWRVLEDEDAPRPGEAG